MEFHNYLAVNCAQGKEKNPYLVWHYNFVSICIFTSWIVLHFVVVLEGCCFIRILNNTYPALIKFIRASQRCKTKACNHGDKD